MDLSGQGSGGLTLGWIQPRCTSVATRLAGQPATLRERPINWGYSGRDAELRSHVDSALSYSQDYPCLAARVGQEEDSHE